MKKLFFSLGAMLVFGIASAQVNNNGLQQNGTNAPLRAANAHQSNTLAKPDPNATPAMDSNSMSNQSPAAAPISSMPASTTTTTTATSNAASNPASTTTTTSAAPQSVAPGNAGQGMGTTTGTPTRRTP